MRSKVISMSRREFEAELNQALNELKHNEIVDIKFTQGSGNNGAIVLSALILYK